MFIYAKKNQDVIAGGLLGIAIFKPTLVILFIPYFLIKRRFKLVFISLVTVSFLAVIGLAVTGIP